MSTVLLTIVGPDGRVDAAAPSDTPLQELLATFAQLTASSAGDARWEVGEPGQPPLRCERTLGDQGVADGSVLHLRPSGAPLEPSGPADAVADAAPDGSTPVGRTRDALPEWLGAGGRLRALGRAALRGATEAPVPDGASGPPSRLARVRDCWRATSYARALDDQIAAPSLRRPVVIAVVAPRPDAGCSTIALLLATLLDRRRSERTVLIDANADDGAQLERTLDDPELSAGSAVVDCGLGLGDRATEAAISAADQLVLVVEPGAAVESTIATAAELLADREQPVVLVVNKLPPSGLDVGWLEREIPAARGLIAVHADAKQAARLRAGTFAWDAGAGTWGLPLRELAAVLVADWARQGLTARHADHARSGPGRVVLVTRA